jgi:serine/threonine protein kinase
MSRAEETVRPADAGLAPLPHIDEEDLVVLAYEGIAAFPGERQQAIHQHLDACPECSSSLAEARRGLQSTQQGSDARSFALLRAGDRVADRYRIVRYVASGGMGDVYEAEDLRLPGTTVALKTLNVAGAGDERAVRRLAREAQVALLVSHPHACRVHHYDVHALPKQRGDVHFLTMEFVEGETLGERLRHTGPLSCDGASALSLQVLDALATAHHRGLLHRDLKSSNIMLRSAPAEESAMNAVIMDFGLAKPVFERGERLTTNSRAFIGSAHYASPEQLMGERLTPGTDIYSFGVVLFEALTGKLPFRGEGALQTALLRVDHPAPGLSTLRQDLPRQWEAIVARCLERQVESRFASARQLRRAIESIPAGRRFIPRWLW